ncbi:hypothetical protein OC835_000908 [Tilletia horrida]|nr:hypothetical protein OC835_000908 [Tilletia horrida]
MPLREHPIDWEDDDDDDDFFLRMADSTTTTTTRLGSAHLLSASASALTATCAYRLASTAKATRRVHDLLTCTTTQPTTITLFHPITSSNTTTTTTTTDTPTPPPLQVIQPSTTSTSTSTSQPPPPTLTVLRSAASHHRTTYTVLSSSSSSSSSSSAQVLRAYSSQGTHHDTPFTTLTNDPIQSLHLLNTGELAAAHARSPSITLFHRASPSQPNSDDDHHHLSTLKTWSLPSSSSSSSTITHHYSLYDAAPALHLLRHTSPDLVQHERVCALALRIASPAEAQAPAPAPATQQPQPKTTRKSALQVMDDLHILPDERTTPTPTPTPNAPLQLQAILIQNRGKEPAAPDRIRILGPRAHIIIPGFESNAADVLACTLHAADGNLSILSRKGSLHTYHLRFSSDGAPTLTHARTFHLHHFHFPTTHPALPKPASVLALSPSHLLLVGLVAVVVPSSSSSSSSSSSWTTTTQAPAPAQAQAQKLRPRIHAAVFDTALEAIVAESDITSALLPAHFSLPSSSSSSSSSSSTTEHNPNGIPDVNFTISTLRSGSHHAVVLLNTLPPASQHKAARKSLTGAGGAPPARSSAALILPYTLPPRSALQHALGKAEPTARWIAPVSLLVPRAGGVNAAAALVSNGTATAGLQAGIKKRRGRKGKSHHNHDKKEEGHGTGQKTPTLAQGQQQQLQPQPLSLPELVAQAQWTQLAHAMRTRPGLAEDELVYALVRAFRSARLPLRDTVLKAFLRLPLSRPLVRAALKRHLRLPSSEGQGLGPGPGAGPGDEVVGAVVVLGDVLCAWVEEWAGVPLHLHPGSGWAPAAAVADAANPDSDSHSGASSAPPTADLPQLDEIILLLTDLLDTFFPTLISASLSHPSVPAFLERTRAALETHARTLQALRVLVPPLNAFAALEADRVRAARAVLAAAEAAAEEEEEEQEQGQQAAEGGDKGRAHPALRGWWNNGLGGAKERPRPRPAHLNKSLHHRRSASQQQQQQQQPGGQKSKKNKSSSSAAAAIGPLEVAPRTATGGGGGAGVNHLQQQGPDAAGRTKRRMMQEASLLVGEYAVEVLEF